MLRASWSMFLVATPLAAWGVWALWAGVEGQQWVTGILGVAAVAAAWGLLVLRPWAKYLAYMFATGLGLSWSYAVWQMIARGWPYRDWLTTVLSLIPGACLLVVCAGGAYVVNREYRRSMRGT
jgi:hypothetical protein